MVAAIEGHARRAEGRFSGTAFCFMARVTAAYGRVSIDRRSRHLAAHDMQSTVASVRSRYRSAITSNIGENFIEVARPRVMPKCNVFNGLHLLTGAFLEIDFKSQFRKTANPVLLHPP